VLVVAVLDLDVDAGRRHPAGELPELAGLAQGDVITKVDGRDVSGADDVSAAVADHKPGDELEITVVRDGQARTLKAHIGRRG